MARQKIPDRVKATITFNNRLLKDLKKQAIDLDVTISEIIGHLVAGWLGSPLRNERPDTASIGSKLSRENGISSGERERS